jgi:hypothetical protein
MRHLSTSGGLFVAMDAFSVITICAVVLSIVLARVWLVIITTADDMITHSHP